MASRTGRRFAEKFTFHAANVKSICFRAPNSLVAPVFGLGVFGISSFDIYSSLAFHHVLFSPSLSSFHPL